MRFFHISGGLLTGSDTLQPIIKMFTGGLPAVY
jgi:hypothetical protein